MQVDQLKLWSFFSKPISHTTHNSSNQPKSLPAGKDTYIWKHNGLCWSTVLPSDPNKEKICLQTISPNDLSTLSTINKIFWLFHVQSWWPPPIQSLQATHIFLPPDPFHQTTNTLPLPIKVQPHVTQTMNLFTLKEQIKKSLHNTHTSMKCFRMSLLLCMLNFRQHSKAQ